jgi:hypothetical protein
MHLEGQSEDAVSRATPLWIMSNSMHAFVTNTTYDVLTLKNSKECATAFFTEWRFVWSGALYRVALCTEWRFVPSGALYRVALCTEWRFVPSDD